MDYCRGLTIPRWLLPALAGFLVGLMGLAVPAVLGTGYGTVQEYLTAEAVLAAPLLLLLVTPLAKIVATSLSIGSGGSGGIFGPGMVIGATLGAALWRVLVEFGEPLGIDSTVGPSPAVYVIVGMAVVFGSVSHAPIAMLLMVAEMTGNLALVPLAMVAMATATLVVGDTTIYRSQLATRADHDLTGGGRQP
jgi:CIC family chloride channel protein